VRIVCDLATIWKYDGNGIVLFRDRQKKALPQPLDCFSRRIVLFGFLM
jgi:hypothetical protein